MTSEDAPIPSENDRPPRRSDTVAAAMASSEGDRVAAGTTATPSAIWVVRAAIVPASAKASGPATSANQAAE